MLVRSDKDDQIPWRSRCGHDTAREGSMSTTVVRLQRLSLAQIDEVEGRSDL